MNPDAYFTKEALALAQNQDINSRDILIYMNPLDFLSIAMSGYSKDKETKVKELVSQEILFNEIPFLNFVHDGEGTARITGHEGRHRARILDELNIKEMPVILRHRYDENGQGMYWSKMNSDLNVFYDMWPSRLYGERGSSEETNKNSKNYILFPIEDLRLTNQSQSTLKIKI